MHKFLAAFLGIAGFLVVCLYWLWQMLSGQPALPIEDIALRALLAMAVLWVLGWLLGRVGTTLASEAWHEAHARAFDRAERKAAAEAAKASAEKREASGGRQ